MCIVGANSLVIHDVPDYCMVAGSPARIIKSSITLHKVGKETKRLYYENSIKKSGIFLAFNAFFGVNCG